MLAPLYQLADVIGQRAKSNLALGPLDFKSAQGHAFMAKSARELSLARFQEASDINIVGYKFCADFTAIRADFQADSTEDVILEFDVKLADALCVRTHHNPLHQLLHLSLIHI